ncbi:MAG TPA: hypothetical protein VKV05_08255 [Terriglobales bacterium]|nr:hypothetical protein [Terriglobales bacterium]
MKYQLHFPSSCIGLSIVAALFLTFALSSAAQPQNGVPPAFPGENGPAPLPRVQPAPDSADTWMVEQQKEMAKKRNQQRQMEIKKDTEKLLELATELKQSVDKSSEDTLSLDVIRKADQIEKLAKAVKAKMSDSNQ